MIKIKKKDVKPIRLDLLKAQRGKCDLCGKLIPEDQACLDHNHDTGVCRGVLCRTCNIVEGRLIRALNTGRNGRKFLDYLKMIVAYWIKHEESQTEYIHYTFFTEEEKKARRNKRARLARRRKKVGGTLLTKRTGKVRK